VDIGLDGRESREQSNGGFELHGGMLGLSGTVLRLQSIFPGKGKWLFDLSEICLVTRQKSILQSGRRAGVEGMTGVGTKRMWCLQETEKREWW
jgi:hypothetical protein